MSDTNISIIQRLGDWKLVLRAARNTVGRKEAPKEPSSAWKQRILMAEHSPIRVLQFYFSFSQIKYWISTHYVRHKYGIEHFVLTQREDRTGVDRNSKPQDSLVDHEGIVNAQEIIHISRKRLCYLAHRETRAIWVSFLVILNETEKEIVSACVPDCIYRGKCYEMMPCSYHKTERFKSNLEEYRSLVNTNETK